MTIRHLKHEEIDKLKWDKCINRSFNGIVYAYSWYLDIVSFHWEALVLEDYDAVMPLPVKKNYALTTLKQPDFTAQLGIFTSKLLDLKLVSQFLDALPEKFRKVELTMNPFNKVSHSKFHSKDCFLYELDLIAPYKSLYLKFSNEVRESIKQSKVNKIQVLKQVNLKDLLLLKKGTSKEPLTFENLNMLRRIIPFTISYNLGETFGAYDDKNELVAAAFFIKSHQKVFQLVSACTPYGRSIKADIAIMNSYIREYAERSMTLNFGEEISLQSEELAKGFGATPVQHIKVKKRSRLSSIFQFKNKLKSE